MAEEKQETTQQAVEPYSFTIEQAAQALQVSERTIRDLLACGAMDDCARLVGRSWRISPTRLRDHWLRGGKHKAAQAGAEDTESEV